MRLHRTFIAVACALLASCAAAAADQKEPPALASQWSVLLPFLAGILGGVVFVPMAEFLKDWIGARRTWAKQRGEIIQTLRLILGTYDGFLTLLDQAFHPAGIQDRTRSEQIMRIARQYDMKLANVERIARLSELHPSQLSLSGVSQHVVALCAGAHASLLALQKIQVQSSLDEPELSKGFQSALLSQQDQLLLKLAKRNVRKLKIFLGSIYAPKIGIDRFSLMADNEVHHFEMEIDKHLASTGDG